MAKIPFRVVWRLRDTADIIVFVTVLRNWDLPEFGAPTIATSRRRFCFVGVSTLILMLVVLLVVLVVVLLEKNAQV